MELLKPIREISFAPEHSLEHLPFHTPDMEVSEPIVMKSAAGWYIGSIARTPMELDDYRYEPYDRYTVYYDKCSTPCKMLQIYNKPNSNICLTSVLI